MFYPKYFFLNKMFSYFVPKVLKRTICVSEPFILKLFAENHSDNFRGNVCTNIFRSSADSVLRTDVVSSAYIYLIEN